MNPVQIMQGHIGVYDKSQSWYAHQRGNGSCPLEETQQARKTLRGEISAYRHERGVGTHREAST